MKRVIVESPFAAPTSEGIERNLRYLRAAMRDCLLRGEAPFASHGLYTQPGVLRDEVSIEREHGIAAGFSWRYVADYTVVYADLGISSGMARGMDDAGRAGHVIETRWLGEGWDRAHEPAAIEAHDPGDEDRRPIYLGPWCESCGDAFDGPERTCPRPAPGREYVDCGRGGHMFRLEAEPRGEGQLR